MKKLFRVAQYKLPAKNSVHSKPTVFSQDHRIDMTTLIIVILLTLFGLLMVYDSSQVEAFQDLGDRYYFFRQQLIWVGLGFGSLAFLSFFNYRHLEKFSLIFLIISIVLLLMVLIPGLGVKVGGAHRWLRFGPMTIQPAEVVKLALVIYLASLFKVKPRAFSFLVITGLIVTIVGVLQRDLGSAIVVCLIALGMFFVANGSFKFLSMFLGLGLIAGIGFITMAPYRIKRVLAFLDPFSDPKGYSYHISQVLIALGSGGLFGVGVGQSRQKFAYIPEVTTDSIFSIVGEEFGFIGALALITLIGYLVVRGLRISEGASDNFGKLLAAGLIIWIGVQALINLAAMVALIPLTGVPLPFISYGGSALLANLIAVGILINISKQSKL